MPELTRLGKPADEAQKQRNNVYEHAGNSHDIANPMARLNVNTAMQYRGYNDALVSANSDSSRSPPGSAISLGRDSLDRHVGAEGNHMMSENGDMFTCLIL